MPHIHDLIDYTAEIFIVYQHKVLIRLHDKYNLWTCPGGHVELDENPNEAAVREAKEETGLDVVLIANINNTLGKLRDKKNSYHPYLWISIVSEPAIISISDWYILLLQLLTVSIQDRTVMQATYGSGWVKKI